MKISDYRVTAWCSISVVILLVTLVAYVVWIKNHNRDLRPRWQIYRSAVAKISSNLVVMPLAWTKWAIVQLKQWLLYHTCLDISSWGSRFFNYHTKFSICQSLVQLVCDICKLVCWFHSIWISNRCATHWVLWGISSFQKDMRWFEICRKNISLCFTVSCNLNIR